jgi:hypothetical protein
MAYGNYLASVDWAEVEGLRLGIKTTIVPHGIASVSHILPGAVNNLTASGKQPVASCLAEILDRGEVLLPSLWHPLRVPVVHSPQAVRALALNLQNALENLGMDKESRYWLDYEVTPVLNILSYAAKNGLGVVSVLEPPADEERAQRVACPFDDPEKLPVPWGGLGKTLRRFLEP